jgi:bacillithiol system protein YtxJ
MNKVINWHPLTSEAQLEQLLLTSNEKYQLIFKHSTRCSISAMALNRLERDMPNGEIDFWFLDLIQYRSVSNHVADVLHVHHESPQVLLIKNGACVYDESHGAISSSDIDEQLQLA